MSQENVEVVRRIFDGWSTGDFGAGLADLDPDVVFVVRRPFPEAGETVGPDGIRDYMARSLDNWETYAVEARDLRAAADTVVADAVQRGVARQVGLRSSNRFSCCSVFAGGKSCGSSPS
jgi:ketosteroid isomerase-like protein